MRGLKAAVGAAGCAAILAACGSDEESTTASTTSGTTGTATTPSEPQPKADFIKQADALCEDGDKEIDAAADEAFQDGEPTPEEIEGFVTQTVVPGVQEQLDGIRALAPPEGAEEEVTEFLDTGQQELDEVEADPVGFGEARGQGYFEETEKLAGDVGLKKCAQ